MSMVQFNLLPDVKLAYIKAERQKQIVLSVSVILSMSAIVLFVLLFSYSSVIQKKSINDLSADISSSGQDLTSTKDLSKILTIQNQIDKLNTLHDNKVITTRAFDYLQKMTPTDLNIELLNIDYAANTLEASGQVSSLQVLNTYADTLKFTTFTATDMSGAKAEKQNAFSNVVLSSFTTDETGVKYTIQASFDPRIFDVKQKVVLEIPNRITSRSVTEKPGSLFQSGGAN
jgi:hypothetical protein